MPSTGDGRNGDEGVSSSAEATAATAVAVAIDDDDAGDVDDGADADEVPTHERRRLRGKHLDRPWYLTYLRKQGKITRAQKNAIRNLWPRYGVVRTGPGHAYDMKAFHPPISIPYASQLECLFDVY